METATAPERIIALPGTLADHGHVRWAPAKSLWMTSMTVVALVGGAMTISWSAFAVFVMLTTVTICAGHSVGMHRKLIHNSFSCPKWLEYCLVYLGVLVGMAGPYGMIWQHDLRDWAQRQKACHDYLRHRRGFVADYFWQVHCDIELDQPPLFELESNLKKDAVYVWMERTWMLQQAPLALLLFWLGGWSFVVWGVAVRVCVSVTGHWLVGHFAHHEYPNSEKDMSWRVVGASVQGRDVRIAGLISMGESWHNNHHAFPGSARIGLLPGQPDPGWWFILCLRKLRLADNIKTPECMPTQQNVVRFPNNETGWRLCRLRKKIWRRIFQAA